MFKFLGGVAREQKELWDMLEHLSLSKAPIRVEIENSLERFTSHLALSKGAVVITRPSAPTLELTAGSHVRARLPGKERRELRLQVVVSRMKLGEATAFVCKPTRRQVPSRRADDRYNVRRYKNLRLGLDGERFRIVDISVSGCKLILASTQSRQLLPLGEDLRSADLTVGSRVTMHLELLIPRSRNGRLVGCEFEISRDGVSDKTLERLITSLDKKEKDRRVS
jgi:hypothetical protein